MAKKTDRRTDKASSAKAGSARKRSTEAAAGTPAAKRRKSNPPRASDIPEELRPIFTARESVDLMELYDAAYYLHQRRQEELESSPPTVQGTMRERMNDAGTEYFAHLGKTLGRSSGSLRTLMKWCEAWPNCRVYQVRRTR